MAHGSGEVNPRAAGQAIRYYVRTFRPPVIVGPFWFRPDADGWAERNGGEVIERTSPIPTIGVADLARRNGVHR